MFVAVHAWAIEIESVCDDLRLNGLFVIETTRTHAKQAHAAARRLLGIAPEGGQGASLIHLAFPVGDRGWSDTLIYSEVQAYVPGKTQAMVCAAVQSWVNAGEPNTHYAWVEAN